MAIPDIYAKVSGLRVAERSHTLIPSTINLASKRNSRLSGVLSILAMCFAVSIATVSIVTVMLLMSIAVTLYNVLLIVVGFWF